MLTDECVNSQIHERIGFAAASTAPIVLVFPLWKTLVAGRIGVQHVVPSSTAPRIAEIKPSSLTRHILGDLTYNIRNFQDSLRIPEQHFQILQPNGLILKMLLVICTSYE